MPFNNKNNTVSYYDFDNPLPTLTENQGKQIPDKAQILQLKGGNGGRLGEKSFKPQIIFAEGEVTDGGDAQTSQNINTYGFGSENDCGFAVKINEDVNNKSQVNIGYINSTSAINIYLSGNDLQFTKLISGSVETSTSFADGVTVKDFTVSTNGTSLISSVLDTDLGLNKYYFDMNDDPNCSKFLTATISDPNGATPAIKEPLTDLLNVYVVETDVNDAYLSYINANQEFTKGSLASVTIEPSKSFLSGQEVRIQESTVKYVTGTITNVAGAVLTVNITGISTGLTISTLALGSFVTLDDIYNSSLYQTSHCISLTSTLKVYNNNMLKDYFNAKVTSGFRFTYEKEKTNTISESKNKLSFYSDSFVSGGTTSENSTGFLKGIFKNPFSRTDRITQRDYIRSQYSGAKSVLIRKNKFSILFNGFYSGGRGNTSNYFSGSYGSATAGFLDTKVLVDHSDVRVSIGNGARKNNDGTYLPYFTMKLYEVLVYKNIANLRSGNPQRIICDYLVSKYKNKAFFDSSEIQTDAPIYYSLSDRPNILGKVQKIITP